MKKKAKDSKLNVLLTALLVVFVCLLSFSIGVISGKGWSDRDYKVKHIQQDSHVKMAMEDTEPLGDEMTKKEVELLTKKALEQAQAEAPAAEEEPQRQVAEAKPEEKPTMEEKPQAEMPEEKPMKEEISSAKMAKAEKKVERKVSSLMPKPTVPKPAAVEYTVQVAAYKSMQEAEDHSQRLIDKGFPAFPVKTMIKGQSWYRVSIGSFKTKKQAAKYHKALKKHSFVKNSFVQKIKRLK